MGKPKKKYYVVWQGRKTGIFDNWGDCNEQILGFKKAQYKSFVSKEMAETAFSESYYEYAGKNTTKPVVPIETKQLFGNPVLNSISVDAAWNTKTGDMEYQGVETDTGNELFRSVIFKDGTNNVGEFLGLVHGLAWLKKEELDLPIYSDSKTAIAWIRNKKANSTLEKTAHNRKLFEVIKRAENWLAKNEYSNQILKWETKVWGEIPADFGRK